MALIKILDSSVLAGAILAKQQSLPQNAAAADSQTSSNKWIDITIEYSGNTMLFSTNPNEINIFRRTRNITYEILELGETVFPNSADLVRVSFTSQFWTERDSKTSGEYLSWINEWRWSQKPGRLVIANNDPAGSSYHGLDIYVLLNELETNEGRAGFEDDVYYTLHFIQYREGSGTAEIEVEDDPVTNEEYIVHPPAMPIQTSQPPLPRMHTVVRGDTLSSIARQYGQPGTAWREMADIPQNDAILSENIRRTSGWRYGDLIHPGQQFIIPESWLE